MFTTRQTLSFSIIAVFLLYFFFNGIDYSVGVVIGIFHSSSGLGIPDFSNYIALRTLSDQRFPINVSNRRVVLVGDIHGMDKSLQSLLRGLAYDPKTDELIHVGDIVAKGSHQGSLSVLQYMTAENATGVRGNHDQKVIEWRSWLNWVQDHPDGRQWLSEMDEKWDKAGIDLEAWITKEWAKRGKKWWKKVPDRRKMFSDHFRIARDMTKDQYNYLLSLPLTLHIPSAHTYIAHGGLLPSDPSRQPEHRLQPLAHTPRLATVNDTASKEDRVTLLRRLQEVALLTDVPQNRDPWVVLNMRGVLSDKSVTRKSTGTPWSDMWNSDMSRCNGFELAKDHQGANAPLPCHPSMIVYGHAASRGLDIKRWSIGLDTGCVYGRRLTALVLGRNSHMVSNGDDFSQSKLTVPFGDQEEAHVVSMKCHKS